MNNDHDRQRPPLECIGSFLAYEPDGSQHTIEIWTRFESVHDRERPRVHCGTIVLTTTQGRDVTRVARGEYRLTDQPEVRLTSTDANAP